MRRPELKIQAFILHSNGDSEYRFLVDGTHIRYISIEAGALLCKSLIDPPCHSRVRCALPPLPNSIWNQGHIVKCPRTGLPVFSSTSLRGDLPGVGSLWHPITIDHLELTYVVRLRQHIGVVTSPQFRGRVVYKYAPFPWMVHGIEQETAAWKSISEHRGDATNYWAPRFLGHVSEEGRVVGFLLEFIPGRPARDEGDWEACYKALEKLHDIGMKHGSIQRGSFLIHKGKTGDEAVLIDMRKAVSCRDMVDLVGERAQLGIRLRLGTTSEMRVYEYDSGHDEWDAYLNAGE